MLNFPLPYREELLYSTIARAGIRHGLISPKSLLDEVFATRNVVATLDLPCHIATISQLLPNYYSPEKLIYEHTLFPAYAPFVPENRRQQCIKWMLDASNGATHLALGAVASRNKTLPFFRYCPDCVAEQKKEYGEYFWRREWQLAGIETCPEHANLINTKIVRPLIERHRFIAASPEYCPLLQQRKANQTINWVPNQVRHLLELSALPSPSYAQWTSYYRHLAYSLGFNRGKAQIDHQLIRESVYQVCPIRWLSKHDIRPQQSNENSDWLQSIFRKHRNSFSYLQHIVVNQALLGDDWSIADVIKEVRNSRPNKKQQIATEPLPTPQKLSSDQNDWEFSLSTCSPSFARKTSPALYARLYRNHHTWLLTTNKKNYLDHSNNHFNRVDWPARDQAYHNSLQQLSIFLGSNNEGPRRSKSYYLKMIGCISTIEKNLYRLPRTSEFLTNHTECVDEYQIRRLQNSYNRLKVCFESPPRWRLLREASLSEQRLTKPARIHLDQLLGTTDEKQRCKRRQHN